MQPQPRHSHWTAYLVVTRIVDVLKVEGNEDTPPDMGRIERFFDGFAAVGQPAIAQNESQTAIRQISRMRRRDAARHERRAGAVEAAMPARAFHVRAYFHPFVIFGVGERLMLAFVPAPASEGPDVRGDFLLEIEPKAVLDRSLLPSRCDIGRRSHVLQILLYGYFIIAHVGVIDVVKDAYGRIF